MHNSMHTATIPMNQRVPHSARASAPGGTDTKTRGSSTIPQVVLLGCAGLVDRRHLSALGLGLWLFPVCEASGFVRTPVTRDRKSTRLNSSHGYISYAVFCLKKKKRFTSASTMSQEAAD